MNTTYEYRQVVVAHGVCGSASGGARRVQTTLTQTIAHNETRWVVNGANSSEVLGWIRKRANETTSYSVGAVQHQRRSPRVRTAASATCGWPA